MGGECETDGSWHVSRPAFTYSVNSLSHGILYTVSAEPEGSATRVAFRNGPRTLNHVRSLRVVGRLEGTKTQAEVAQAIGVSQSVISRIWNRFLETGSAGRRPVQGRRRTTKPNEDRFLVLTARRHRNMNATLLQQHLRSATGTTVSTQTVRNRLHGVGLYARRSMVCVRLTSRRRDHRGVATAVRLTPNVTTAGVGNRACELEKK
ncbi:transposable element Tcb2 transposase [Trichonephila clavipes]|nr:transposable element Tcb2 transposase [Trichonephila clavipes]